MGEKGASNAGKKTMKEMALEALNDHPDGLEARAILTWIKEHYGLDLSKESFSPQLSRLGQEGAILRNGLVWRLAACSGFVTPENADPLGGAAIGASNTEDDTEEFDR